MKTTRQVSRTALLSRFVHAAMPWGLCSRCGWCLVPVPCLVHVRALIVSSFNPSPASRHTQPAHGGVAFAAKINPHPSPPWSAWSWTQTTYSQASPHATPTRPACMIPSTATILALSSTLIVMV
ncbi:hypothetical protein V8C40DRAFT_37558 [Trichoderma camerunense]